MSELRVLLTFLVLGAAVSMAITDRPPIMRWGYELVNFRGRGGIKPGKVYG